MRRKPGVAVPQWSGHPFHVFAADPGGTTGCATASWKSTGPDDRLTHPDQIKFAQWQIGPDPHHLALWSTLVNNGYSEVVWESFEFRQHLLTDEDGRPIPKLKVELISREYIGIMQLFCEFTHTPAHHRTASSAKRFITDERIKELGLWLPGMPHAMDATRHLLRYLVVVKKINRPFTDIWLAD